MNVISFHYKKNLNQELDFDCSMKDCGIINFLADGKKTMSQISDFLILTPGTTTIHIDSMIEKGFVKRDYDKEDRRKIYIELSEKGLKLQ